MFSWVGIRGFVGLGLLFLVCVGLVGFIGFVVLVGLVGFVVCYVELIGLHRPCKALLLFKAV